MKAPRIGLTTYPVNDLGQYPLPANYVHAVGRAGGLPLLLPPLEHAPIEGWLDTLDGLILTGGGDIDPARYRDGSRHETVYNLSAERDAAELALVHACLARRLPVLAICRGLQILNTALGGTLHQHVPDHYGERVAHRQPPRNPIPHGIRIAPECRLAALIGTQVQTASWHHQAIRDLAPGLRAVAWATDDLIEAVEVEGHPEWVAVQWHPEITAQEDAGQQALFNHLVQQARERVHHTA